MIIARIARVTPGRPEADLGIVTVNAKPRRRGQPDHRFDAHVVTGGQGADGERTEHHVFLDTFPPGTLGVDLLEAALRLARYQREDLTADAPDPMVTAVMDRDMLRWILHVIEEATARGLGDTAPPNALHMLDQLRAVLGVPTPA